jgi:hypothetical protein
MGDQLVDFLRSRNAQSHHADIDWQSKKDAWVRSVDALYGTIEEMLRDSIAAGDVALRRFDVQVTEDFIGEYTIPALELRVGGERVEFRPKGVNVIGAAGRVDLRGERDTVTLVKGKADANGEWAVVLQRVPSLKMAPLDRESLTRALEQAMLPLP